MFKQESPLMLFLSRVTELFLLNLLAIVFSLPLVTVGAAVTALYEVLFAIRAGKDVSVVKKFWTAFRNNFKKATVLWLLCVPFCLAVMIILQLCIQEGSLLRYAVCLFSVLLVGLWISYAFPLTARFDNTIKNTIGNAFALAIGHLPISLLVMAGNLLPLLFWLWGGEAFRTVVLIWTVIGFSGVGWVNADLLDRVFHRYISEEQT